MHVKFKTQICQLQRENVQRNKSDIEKKQFYALSKQSNVNISIKVFKDILSLKKKKNGEFLFEKKCCSVGEATVWYTQ